MQDSDFGSDSDGDSGDGDSECADGKSGIVLAFKKHNYLLFSW